MLSHSFHHTIFEEEPNSSGVLTMVDFGVVIAYKQFFQSNNALQQKLQSL